MGRGGCSFAARCVLIATGRNGDHHAGKGSGLQVRRRARRALPDHPELGAGGMGTVFLAEHVLIKRRVAIKILHPDLATDATSSSAS